MNCKTCAVLTLSTAGRQEKQIEIRRVARQVMMPSRDKSEG